jgi:hypothetical protein
MIEQAKAAWDAAMMLMNPAKPAVEVPVVEAPAAIARGVDGKFAPKGDKEPESEPVAPDPQADEPKQETTASKPPSAKATKEMSKALTALRRARLPQSRIDKLSPEEVLEWGSDLAEVQSAEDRRRREGKEPSKDPNADDADGSPDAEADPESDDDETQAFGFEQASMLRENLALHARTELRGDFPALSDAKTWQRVREQAIEAWLESDAYDHFDDYGEGAVAAVRDAAIALGVARSTSKVTSPVRDASQPSGSRPGDRYAAYKGMSPHDLTMTLLKQGKPPLEVRQIVEELHART